LKAVLTGQDLPPDLAAQAQPRPLFHSAADRPAPLGTDYRDAFTPAGTPGAGRPLLAPPPATPVAASIGTAAPAPASAPTGPAGPAGPGGGSATTSGATSGSSAASSVSSIATATVAPTATLVPFRIAPPRPAGQFIY